MFDKHLVRFDDIDKARAIKIAENWLRNFSESEKAELKHDVFRLLERWKLKHGVARRLHDLFGMNVDEKERRSLIKDLESWESTPLWVEGNPMDLLIHLWSSNFMQPLEKFLFNYLAILIIFSGSKDVSEWIPAMVRNALWLAEIQNDALYGGGQKMFPLAKRTAKNINAFMNSEKMNLKKKESHGKKLQIHRLADQYLAQGKPHRSIISMIERSKLNLGIDLGDREIRRKLADHPSGYWAKKKK